MVANTGNWEINLIKFHAKGGTIVCLDGDVAIRVRDLVDIQGLLGAYYVPHFSSARTFLGKRSTSSFVERQYIVPFKLLLPQGSITVLCDGEIHAQALEVLANSGYIKGDKLIELEPAKLWQQIGPTHSKKGLVLSTSHGGYQTAAPCTFMIAENMLFETSDLGAYRDTGSQFSTGSGVEVKAGSVSVKPIALQSKLYTRSSGLLGFSYVKSTSTQEHKRHQRASYIAVSGDVIFCATSKDITVCAITVKAPQGRGKFIANQGKVELTQATDEHHIITNTKSIGISFGMSDSVLHAMRGDFSQAMQSAVGELQVAKDVKGLLNAEGVVDNGIKGILAANSIVQSLLMLKDKGLAGFLAGNLNDHLEIKFSKQHETINFTEIVGNWLLAKEIIVQSKKNLELEAVDLSCQDLSLTTTAANIKVDGGVVNNSSYIKSIGVNVGINADSSIRFGVSSSRGSTQSTIHGISNFRITGNAYISAIKGEVSFRNAILEARRAYIEALQLKLESSRDEVIEKMQSA